MKMIALLALLPLRAAAWEFSPDPLCTLTHQAETAEIVITKDVTVPEYTLTVMLRSGAWPDAPVFFMDYPNGVGPDISTNRHTLSADRATLIVRDRGFENVLIGLEENGILYASSGGLRVTADVAMAFGAVQEFRACPADAPATS